MKTRPWAALPSLLLLCATAVPQSRGNEGGRILKLRTALRVQAKAYCAISGLRFVAVARAKIVLPKAKVWMRAANGWFLIKPPFAKITYRSRFAFWGDGRRYRIDWYRIDRGSVATSQVLAWNGHRFQVFDPGQRTLKLWPKPQRGYVGVPPHLNPMLEPLAFTQPPGWEKKRPWLNWLTFNRLKQHLGSVLARCNAVEYMPPPPGRRGLWGKIKGSSSGLPTIFQVGISRKPPHLVVEIRMKVSRFPWSDRRISYKAYKIGTGVVWLPRKISTPRKATANRLAEGFFHVHVDQPFSPAVYTINFKLARLIIMGATGKVVHVGQAR